MFSFCFSVLFFFWGGGRGVRGGGEAGVKGLVRREQLSNEPLIKKLIPP